MRHHGRGGIEYQVGGRIEADRSAVDQQYALLGGTLQQSRQSAGFYGVGLLT